MDDGAGVGVGMENDESGMRDWSEPQPGGFAHASRGSPHGTRVGELLGSRGLAVRDAALRPAVVVVPDGILLTPLGIRMLDADTPLRLMVDGGAVNFCRLFMPNAAGVGVGASLFLDILPMAVEVERAVVGVGRTVLAGPSGFGAVGARPILMRCRCQLDQALS